MQLGDTLRGCIAAALTGCAVQSLVFSAFVDGELRSFDARVIPLSDAEVLMFVRDETEQLIREQGMREAAVRQQEELRGLAQRLAELQETTQRHLVQELHDQVGRNLTALGLILTTLRADLAMGSALKSETPVLFDEATALVQETTSVMRDIMSELHPPLLDEFGLPDALEWYVSKVGGRAHADICLHVEPLMARLCPAAENALFRIAQEAIDNALKHAQATCITVSLDECNGVATLVVADDGVGFSPSSERGQGRAPHWGLLTMRERVLGVGGQLRIESQRGVGTRIVVEVPA